MTAKQNNKDNDTWNKIYLKIIIVYSILFYLSYLLKQSSPSSSLSSSSYIKNNNAKEKITHETQLVDKLKKYTDTKLEASELDVIKKYATFPEDIDSFNLNEYVGLTETEKKKLKNYKNSKINYIFYGPPGTGKTTIAKAICKSNDMIMFVLNGAKNMYFGNTEQNIKNIYNVAKKIGSCVIFIDEMETFCKKRSGAVFNSNTDETTSALLPLINEQSKYGIHWIGAVNDINMLDSAIKDRFQLVLLNGLSEGDIRKMGENKIKEIFGNIEIDTNAREMMVNDIKNMPPRDVIKFLLKISECVNSKEIKIINNQTYKECKNSRFFGSKRRPRRRSKKISRRKSKKISRRKSKKISRRKSKINKLKFITP